MSGPGDHWIRWLDAQGRPRGAPYRLPRSNVRDAIAAACLGIWEAAKAGAVGGMALVFTTRAAAELACGRDAVGSVGTWKCEAPGCGMVVIAEGPAARLREVGWWVADVLEVAVPFLLCHRHNPDAS